MNKYEVRVSIVHVYAVTVEADSPEAAAYLAPHVVEEHGTHEDEYTLDIDPEMDVTEL